MISLFGNKKIHAFGLDISDSSVKVMELRPKGDFLFPNAFAEVPLTPANVISNHMIVNEEKLADNISRAIATAGKIDTRYVIASIPEAKSFVRLVKIPKMPLSEIEGAIPWELEQDIPIPLEQVYLDWQMVAEVEDKFEILVTATPKEYVDALIDTLKGAKLKPVALELESQSTARALVAPEDSKQVVLILDMSATLTNMIIVNNGLLEYTSSIPLAGNTFTENIARALSVPPAEAEKLKRELGLLTETKRGNIRQAILPLLDNIVDEIKNVVKFHDEHSADHKSISKVLLCGGSSKLLGIADYISARLNLGAGKPLGRIVLADPLVNLKLGSLKEPMPMSKDQALSFGTVIGLALRGVNVT